MDMLSIVTGINTASGVNIFEESPAKKKLEKKSVSNKDKKDKLELLLGKFEKAHANVEKALKWLDKNENKLTEEEKNVISEKLEKGVLEAAKNKAGIEEILETDLKTEDIPKVKKEMEKIFGESESEWDF